MPTGNLIEDSYEKPTRLDLHVPASMLESVAGWEDEGRAHRELSFALGAADLNDPDTLRWLAACIEGYLDHS